MHTIRLRRPWERFVDEQTESVRVDVPDLDPPSVNHSARYVRTFNQPTGVDADQKLELVVDGWSGKLASVSLNDSQLEAGEDEAASMPLRVCLPPLSPGLNRVEIVLRAASDDSPCLSGAVCLAIH